MRNLGRVSRSILVFALLAMAAPGFSQESQIAYGSLQGRVDGVKAGVLPVVYAYNTERDVAYTVFVVEGIFEATHLFPGTYEVTIRPAVGQLESFTPETTPLTVKAGEPTQIDFELKNVGYEDNYVSGVDYPDAAIVPYDEAYPPELGREILERTCHGCHSVNFFPYNVPRAFSGGRAPKDKSSWAFTVDRMHKGQAFGRETQASYFDPKYLPPADRDILVEYLAESFPFDAPPTVVKLEEEPELDMAALKKAMFVEYIYREPEGKYDVFPWPHQIDFDIDGNVWLAYTKCCIVRFDPRTGEQTVFEGHGGGHGIAVDQTDGTVWYSGDVVRRLDPATGLVDHWKIPGSTRLGSNTQIFDSKGNLWLSLLAAGSLGKWERATDTIKYWDVPVLRSRPYGIIVDRKDKVWFADYHNNGLTRFDPDTEEFKHFNLIKADNVTSIRRLGVDSNNMIWAGTWGDLAFKKSNLYKLNPETEEVTEYQSGIPYASIYNAEADNQDNIWIAADNYVSRFDQKAEHFTHYPMPTRSDSLKTTITRDGGVWFIYRNAGKYEGYGGSAVVLYQDMHNIETLAAYHDESSAGYLLSKYTGPAAPKVKGTDRIAPVEPQNVAEFAVFLRENKIVDMEVDGPDVENPE